MNTYLTQTTIEIFRQTYVGNKSSYASVGTFDAYVTPTDEKETTENDNQFGQTHFVMVKSDVDLRDGDRIIFDGFVHGVEGTKKRVGITLPNFTQALTRRQRKTT